MRRKQTFLLGWLVLLSACAAGGEELPPCAAPDDCRAGHRCINGSCVPPGVDAGPGRDAGSDARPEGDAASPPMDAGPDTAPPDAALPDVGAPDAGGPCGAPCRHYILRADSSEWERHAMPDGSFAPTTPVRAAFDIEDDGVAYLLTDATYHVLDLGTLGFTGGGARDELLPEARGAALTMAETIPAGHAGGDPAREGFIINAEAVAYQGYIVRATRDFVVETVVTEFGPDWSGPLAPSRSELRADWLDVSNARGWVTANPAEVCAASTPRVATYHAIVTPTSVHLYDAGHCFEFVERHPFTTFAPFRAPGAPAPRDVVAAFFHQGDLHVFVD